jgi:hypothetical protein
MVHGRFAHINADLSARSTASLGGDRYQTWTPGTLTRRRRPSFFLPRTVEKSVFLKSSKSEQIQPRPVPASNIAADGNEKNIHVINTT